MLAKDIMTRDVVSLGPNLTIHEAAKVLVDAEVSAVPVIDKTGALVGILSEGDLMRRTELGTEKKGSWWLDLLTFPDLPAAEFVKAHGTRVSDVMTHKVITVSEDAPLTEIAAILEKNRIKRVPVMRAGSLVGIVSRANLVRALATAADAARPEGLESSDSDLRERVLDEIGKTPYGSPWLLTVTVNKGQVTLWGPTHSDLERRTIRIAAEATAGVRGVTDQLFQWPRQTA